MNLTPITKPKPAPPFQVCDIETMNWTKFIVLGYFDGSEYLEFRTIKKFLNFIKTKPDQNIYAHFGGKFDLLFVLQAVLSDETLEISNVIPRGSSILGLDFVYKGNKVCFHDSAALLPFSLKSLSENFNTATTKKEYDHTKTRGYSKELSSYLKADCISLWQCLEKYYQWPLIKAAGPAYTMAGQALKVFRTFLKYPIPGMSRGASDYCRNAYLGGRTEIFKTHFKGQTNEKLFEYDVNSLYPFVMLHFNYPVDRGYFTFRRTPEALGIYKASVFAPSDIAIPSLGLIKDSKYIFPVGRFEGYWTGVELDYAVTQGYRIQILEGHEFSTSESIFSEYITELYKIRETSPKNSVSNVIAKLLMNSLYGRFGMNTTRENLSFEFKENSKEHTTLKIKNKNVTIYTEPVELDSFVHTGIAAHVTAYARIHMHKLMLECGDSLYYTDTDSLFTTKKFKTSSALGDLKLEHEYDSACFLLPKTYIATSAKKTKIAMKGFDKRKIEHFGFDDFMSALDGDLKRMKVTSEPKFASLKTALAQKKIVTMTKASDKQLRAIYSKRIVLKNGDTKPITLEESKNEHSDNRI